LSGCGHWSAASLDKQTSKRIDNYLQIGMSRQEFDELFPTAELWREQDGRSQYVISLERTCFWCYSSKGFATSREYYVRLAQFEGDKLASIDPMVLQR
jgi:hypothetical protein